MTPSDASGARLTGPAGDEGPVGDYCLAVEGLSKRFDDGPVIFQDLNVRVQRGEILVIVGESGIGKSVFLKHLIGLEEPSEGKIWYRTAGAGARDHPVHLLTEGQMKEIRQQISMVFQSSSLFDWMSVFENIALPMEQHRERLEARLESYEKRPHELLALIERAVCPPSVFARLSASCEQDRRMLLEAHAALCLALRGTEDARDLKTAIAIALGLDVVRTGGDRGRHVPDASVWAPASSLLSRFAPAVLGDLLELTDETDASGPLAEFRVAHAGLRTDLRRTYAALRASWGSSFEELALVLTRWWLAREGQPVEGRVSLECLLERVGARLRATSDSPEKALEPLARVMADFLVVGGGPVDPRTPPPDASLSTTRVLAEVLSVLKVRPDLLEPALAVAGNELPAGLRAHAGSIARFRDRLTELAARLAARTRDVGDAGIRYGLMRAWLSRHPMPVDPSPDAEDLSVQIAASFAGRPAHLGRLLDLALGSAGAGPGHALPGPIGELAGAYRAFRDRFSSAYAALLARPRQPVLDAFTELVVTSLMGSLKLDVVSDRDKLPSQLSGGMRTRVGLARSLASMPAVVLYDEPTAGLDPVLSQSIAREILELQMTGLVETSIVVTHDKDLYRTLRMAGRTRMLYLSGGRFLDVDARPVRDVLRLDEVPVAAAAIVDPGPRGYEPSVFIREFEPVAGAADTPPNSSPARRCV